MTRAGRTPIAALVVAALIAVAFYWRALAGGFLSDDFLLNYLLDPTSDGPRVAWHAVFADFGRPWLGIEGSALFRPMMSVSYGIDLALGGASASLLHATNLACHVVCTVAVAWLAAAVVPARRFLAALVAGVVFAVHPAGVEAVAWIAGRVSSLEAAWSLLALVGFWNFAKRGGPGRFVGAALPATLALLTKESAAALPVAFLAIDLLGITLHTGATRRGLVARHVRFVPLWLGYVLWRSLALGTLLGTHADAASPIAAYAGTLGPKLAMLAPGAAAWVPLLVLLGAAWAQHGARMTLLTTASLVAWVLLGLIPAYGVSVEPPLGGSRLLYGLLPALAFFAALAVGGGKTSITAIGAVAATLVALTFGRSTWRRVDGFVAQWNTMARLRDGLALLCTTSTPERPLAVVSTPSQTEGIPFLNPNAVFPLAEVPFAPRSRPLVGLNCVLERIEGMKRLFQDAAPLRAVLDAGGRLAAWNAPGWTTLEHPTRALPELAHTGGNRWSFAAGKVSPFAIEELRFEVDAPGRVRSLRFLPRQPGVAALPVTGTRVDLSHRIELVALALSGGLAGFELDIVGTSAEHVRVSPVTRVASLRLVHKLTGARVRLGSEARQLMAPSSPSGAQLRLVLLGPHGGHVQDVRAGAPVTLSGAITLDLRRLARGYRQRVFWYYFDCAGARSALDWFRLATPAEPSDR